MSDKLCVDLCSGLGGFSRAFADAGWEVITVDINPKFRPTICADILTLTAKEIEAKTAKGHFGDYSSVVVLASPPCERFSLAATTSRGNTRWPSKGIRKALETVGACLELIHDIQPDAWVLENPKARLRWFLGKPTIEVYYQDFGEPRYKPTDIWTNIVLPLLDGVRRHKENWMKIPGYKEMTWAERRRFRHEMEMWSIGTRDPAKRALIPYGLSRYILEAVEEQGEVR